MMQLKLQTLSSLPSLIVMAVAAFTMIDLLPALGTTQGAPYWLLAPFESMLILQLISAWRNRFERLPLAHLYLLIMIFLLRMIFPMLGASGILWAFRAGSVHTLSLGLFGYLGIMALHPSVYLYVQRLSQSFSLWPILFRTLFFIGFLIFFAWACSHFRSYHITRDGFDWIERTTQPVWHLYMREPLTIGLYRWVFLLVWEPWEITSFQVIGMLSIASGIWWAIWFGLLVENKWADGFDRLLAWLLMLSSGGLMVLFFAHIEVYPLFIAGLMPAFYYAHRYLQGTSSIFPVAIFFGIAFLLHLSAGWLLPAFVLLPFFKEGNSSELGPKWKGSLIGFLVVFGLIQGCFWLSLISLYYGESLTHFWARMHETFFVGPDRAMFLPYWLWFHPGHWFDLVNVYLYFSLPCFLLIPVCIMRIPARFNRELVFWLSAAGGYFLYTYFWNADRGYPEDWDLFSPFTLLVALLVLHLALPLSTENSTKSTFSTEYQRSLIYLAAVGVFAFTCSQIYYHHIVPFIPLQYR